MPNNRDESSSHVTPVQSSVSRRSASANAAEAAVYLKYLANESIRLSKALYGTDSRS